MAREEQKMKKIKLYYGKNIGKHSGNVPHYNFYFRALPVFQLYPNSQIATFWGYIPLILQPLYNTPLEQSNLHPRISNLDPSWRVIHRWLLYP